MAYEYCVVWWKDAKSWLEGYPRPRFSECKCFHSLQRAIKFSKEWSPPARIYKFIVTSK